MNAASCARGSAAERLVSRPTVKLSRAPTSAAAPRRVSATRAAFACTSVKLGSVGWGQLGGVGWGEAWCGGVKGGVV